MRIKAYTYEADIHCVTCAVKKFALPVPALENFRSQEHYEIACRNVNDSWLDENRISAHQTDSEGNKITPVFSTDESSETHCGTCRQEL